MSICTIYKVMISYIFITSMIDHPAEYYDSDKDQDLTYQESSTFLMCLLSTNSCNKISKWCLAVCTCTFITKAHPSFFYLYMVCLTLE